MKLLDRFKRAEVIFVTGGIAVAIFLSGVGFMTWFNSEVGPIRTQAQKTAAEVSQIRADLVVTKAQAEDALDARLEYVTGKVSKYQEKISQGKEMTQTEREDLRIQLREQERLKKLRYGVKE